MKIDFTDKQFVCLLKILYLGTWMADTFNPEPSGEFDDLEQHILSSAEGFGLKDQIPYDENLKAYSWNVEFEKSSSVAQTISQYDEDVFWYELIHRMGERDFLRAYGADAIGKMSIEERFRHQEEYIKGYEEEFGANGIENLAVVDITCLHDNSE